MSKINSTRLRYLSSKDPELVTAAINNLPFKVELKSQVVLNKELFIFFVLPEMDNPLINDFVSRSLDDG